MCIYTGGSRVIAYPAHVVVEQLLTPKTLASTLGIAEQTIYNRHSIGGNLPPAIKLGHLLRFRPADVEAWLEVQRQSAPPLLPSTPRTQHAPAVRKRGRPTKAEQIAARRVN
jgi:predicted DNA-binding transcriptional regulator AlpA